MNIRFDSETGTVQVDGAKFSLEVLRELANPDQQRYYRFVRVGETIFVNSFAALHIASGGFVDLDYDAHSNEHDRAIWNSLKSERSR